MRRRGIGPDVAKNAPILSQTDLQIFCFPLDIRVPQTVEHNAGELRVCVLPFEELLADQHRLHRQTVG